jgi:transcription elongation factor GreA
MAKYSYITNEGLQKLKEEHEYLTSVERHAISRLIADARDKGDLAENAEYAAAKEAQGMLELKIARLENTISKARVIDESKIDASTVQILTKVKIRNTKNKQVMKYMLVSESEANLKDGKIAVNSPIARGLIGKKVGDVVDINVPSGIIHFEIMEITR